MTDIRNMDKKVVEKYSSKPYPLLTDNEISLVNTLIKENKLNFLTDNATSLINKYFQAKKHVGKVEQFVINNKANIDSKDKQTIDTLLKIASEGPFGINTSKPIYSTIMGYSFINEIDNLCLDIEKPDSYTRINNCNNLKTQKLAVDPFGRIHNYKNSNMCLSMSKIAYGSTNFKSILSKYSNELNEQ